jgi:hypothetical protein
MSTPSDRRRESTLEAVLDGLQEGLDRDAVAKAAQQFPDGVRHAELQRQIDNRLRELFQADHKASARITGMLPVARASQGSGADVRPATSRRHWLAACAALAASLAIAFIGLRAIKTDSRAPRFVARPLADVYRDLVADGFEPYYECREADRFADTFQRRQGQPLQLLPLPAGAVMLGLSYPGGLSRDTTAMLCRVEGQPVAVFVDRLAADGSFALEQTDAKVHVFRSERDGLVFYEVGPLEAPRVMQSLAPAADAAPKS